MREIRKKVEESAEYVGPRFAEEARRIHYKETDEDKGIYGEATLDQAVDEVVPGAGSADITVSNLSSGVMPGSALGTARRSIRPRRAAAPGGSRPS